ncbi:histone chaperone asf1-like [Pollicipes pollicipes]|uniref:histone chaperone asf1-like n=1 Tax=Pollicipes pollicipes TaxID=41117 RepID=UPI0018853A9A|nr:histone chaperone asf1-like [Pollicipes pollicipes]
MAKVHITNVSLLDNPAQFFSPFKFEITFEAIEALPEDLEWKIIYVGSAESEEHDQVLDTVFVGPVPEGRHMFVFDAPAPDTSKIPLQDALGVTVVLLTCSYRRQEFVRVGYYVNNDYADPELKESPPEQPQFDKMQRNILASSPRVTRFKIEWGEVVKQKPTIDLAVHNQMPPRYEDEENTFDLSAKLPAPVSPTSKVEPVEDFMDFSL